MAEQQKVQLSMTSLVDNIYPIIKGVLEQNPNNIKALKSAVAEYLDANMSKLSSAGPVIRTLFTDNDKRILYNNTGTSPELVERILPMSAYIKKHWRNILLPFNVICALTICYAKRSGNKELAQYMLIYLTLSMYPSLHAKYFKYGVNPQIMDYTINNLSNKYKIKQMGTIWNTLLDTAMVCDKTYTRNIIRANDKDITDYIESLKTRLNALLKKIKSEYTRNYNDKNLMNVEQDNDDPDNFSKAESNSYIIERLANSIALKISIGGPDMKLVDISAKINMVAVNDLRTTINNLTADKVNAPEIKKAITAIITLYMSEANSTAADIHTQKFILVCLQIYKRSNTSDRNIIEIKRLLDMWLQRYSDRYKKSNRVATLNSFRKALFTYFVLTIQANAPR